MAKETKKTSKTRERNEASASAPTKTIEKTEEKTPEKAFAFSVTHDTTDAEIVRLESEGAQLSFDGENFRVLDEPTIQVLSHVNARAYFMAYGEWKVRNGKKEKRKVEQIIDPLGGHEEARLHFGPRGPEGVEFLKRNHLVWKWAQTCDGDKQVGYKEVSEEDPVEVGISSNASGHYLTKDLQGRDELLLMKIDVARYNEHMKAVSQKSQRQIKGARANFESDLDRVSKGQVRPMKETEEDQTVEKVRVTRETVNEAFKQK